MTAATRKTKTADELPLLQKGDRITGKTAKGTPYTGTFEGYDSRDLALCHTGEKTIALNPATVERLAGHGNDPTRVQPALPLLQEKTVVACDRCQHGALQQAVEGLAVSCTQNRFAGAVMAGEIIAQATAQSCDEFAVRLESGLQVGDRCYYVTEVNTAQILALKEGEAQLKLDLPSDPVWLALKDCHPLTAKHVKDARTLEPGTSVKGQSMQGKGYQGAFKCLTAAGMAMIDQADGKPAMLVPGTLVQLEDKPQLVETIWTLKYGDRVRGENLDGKTDQGVITQLGSKYAILDNQQRRNVKVDSLELLQAQAVPEDLLYLVGLPWIEQVDQLFRDRGIFNFANFIGTKPDLTFFESWRGWIVSFNGGTEVHLCKAGRQEASWFFTLSKQPKHKGNGDISKFCQKAIDAVEAAIAAVEAGMSGQASESEVLTVCQNFHPGDRIRVTHSDTPADIGRLGTVQPPWDSQQQAAAWLKVLLDGDEVCRAFKPEQVELAVETAIEALPTQAIVSSAQPEAIETIARLDTLAAEVEAIFAEAEEAEATMLNAGRAAFTRSLALGEKLLAAKAEPEIGGYGKWLPWLEQRGIPERKAQRAIRLYSHRQLLEQSDAVTELTLTEALERISKKSLKPAIETIETQDSDIGGEWQAKIPEAIEQRYQLTGDHATPALEELMVLYSQIGTVRRWKKNGFAVERDDMGAPFPLAFRDRANAWKRWQEEWRSFAVEHPLSATEPPANDVSTVSEKTEGLQGEIQPSNAYEYEPIDPKPVWFDPGGGVVEGQAIGANGKGMLRIAWGEAQESDVPRDRVQWSDPAITAVTPEVEAGLAVMGIEVCAPSISPEAFNREMWGEANPTFRPVQPNGLVEDRPACSRWEPEEIDRVASIQLQGLLKHLEPAELVKAAIVHSGVSLVDATLAVLALADEEEFAAIAECLMGRFVSE